MAGQRLEQQQIEILKTQLAATLQTIQLQQEGMALLQAEMFGLVTAIKGNSVSFDAVVLVLDKFTECFSDKINSAADKLADAIYFTKRGG